MKAAIYTRVSTDRQAEEGFSLEAQHDILMDVLERKDLQLYRVYSDPGVSGGSFKRPGIQMMLNDMKAKKFDTILVHKLDRLSRNLGDLYSFIDMINRLDVRLIIAAQGSEEIDTRSPMGKAFLFFSGIWAQIYLENLREETLKGLTKKVQSGGKHISRPPLGYEFDDKYNLVITEDEAKLVRQIYEHYLKGWGVVKIAKHMNDFSRGKEGGKWDSKNIRNVLTNPTYTGSNHFKPAHWTDDKRIITEGEHEAIISPEEFEKVKAMMDRKSVGHMSKTSYLYAFSGIVKCSKCGGSYVGNSTKQNGKVYKSYRCFNNYTNNTCDQPSISEITLKNALFERVQTLISGKQEKKKKPDKELLDLQKEVDISNRRRKNWMLALGDGNMSANDYAMMVDEEESRMKAVYAKLQEQQAEQLHTPEIPLDELKNKNEYLQENWNLIEDDLQKELIQSMIRKIVIEKRPDSWEIVELLTV